MPKTTVAARAANARRRAKAKPVQGAAPERNKGFYIRTYTGKQFHFAEPETHEYDIHDIAHALSLNCRWTGHVRDFYSVAQHCVLCSYVVPKEHALAALLHDASEAYVHDTPSPLKWHLKKYDFTAFEELDNRIDQSIFKFFGVPWPRHPSVKEADMRMLATEHRDLMPAHNIQRAQHGEDFLMPDPYDWHIRSWKPAVAKSLFLTRYYQLRA